MIDDGRIKFVESKPTNEEMETKKILDKFAKICGFDMIFIDAAGNVGLTFAGRGDCDTMLFISDGPIDLLDGEKHEVLNAVSYEDALKKLWKSLKDGKTITYFSKDQNCGLFPTVCNSIDNNNGELMLIVLDSAIRGVMSYE